MPKTILFNNNWLPEVDIERLKGMGYIVKIVRNDLSEDRLIEELDGMNAFVVAGATEVTERVINAVANDLEIIAFAGVGYEKYVKVDVATQAGIPVTYTPGANARSVAEFVFGLLLSLSRHIEYFNDITRKGGGIYGETTWALQNRTIGIVGMGNVGKNVAQIALHGFHMRVVYHSRTRKPEVEKEIGIEWAPSLSDLLKQSDVVTLHPPYGTETIGLIGTDEFKLMKKNAILINIARPAIVDPKALHNALKKKLISGAAIDGYYEEPIPSKVKDKFGLVEFPKEQLIITPHVAFNTDNSLVKMKDMFLSSILAVFRNENEIPHLINPEYKNFARSQYPWRKK